MAQRWQRRLGVVPEGVEHLVMGYLMCRNIQVRKAPPNTKGYDLLCIPGRRHMKPLRIQVKSRSQEDNDGSVPLNKRTIDGFDYLVAVFLNVTKKEPTARPEFYSVSQQWVRDHHQQYPSGSGKVFFKKKRMKGTMGPFKDARGLEQIARKLGVPRPALY